MPEVPGAGEHHGDAVLVGRLDDFVVAQDARDQDDMIDRASRITSKEGFAKPGQRIIIVAGIPLGTPGATNMIRIAFLDSEAAQGL